MIKRSCNERWWKGKKVEIQDWRLTTIVADVDTDAGAGAGQGFWPGSITTNALGADRQIADSTGKDVATPE